MSGPTKPICNQCGKPSDSLWSIDKGATIIGGASGKCFACVRVSVKNLIRDLKRKPKTL
jgi:hypothetical protein